MKRIAILTCLNANTVCTGAGCLRAFYEKTGAFSRYAGEPLRLMAFFHCPGCGNAPDDEGTAEKLERIHSMGVDAVHIGVCGMKGGALCPTMQILAERLARNGAQIVLGTH